MLIALSVFATFILCISILFICILSKKKIKSEKQGIDFYTFANILKKLKIQFYIKSLIDRKEYFYILNSNKQILNFKKHLIRFDNYKQIHSIINLAYKSIDNVQKIEMKMMGETVSHCSITAIKSLNKVEAVIAIFTNINNKVDKQNELTEDLNNAVLNSTFGIAVKDKYLNTHFANTAYSEMYNQNYSEITKIETQHINHSRYTTTSNTFTIFRNNTKTTFCVKIHNFVKDKFFILVDSIENNISTYNNNSLILEDCTNEIILLNKIEYPCTIIDRVGNITATNNAFNILFQNYSHIKQTKNLFHIILQSDMGVKEEEELLSIKNKLTNLEHKFQESNTFHFMTKDMKNVEIEISQYKQETLLCCIKYAK